MLTYYKLKCFKEYYWVENKVSNYRKMYIQKINVFDSFFPVGLCTIHFKNESDQS